MNDQISSLIKLQDIDSRLDGMKDRCQAIDDEVRGIQEDISGLKTALEESKGELKQLQVEHKEFELDLQAKESEIAKHKTELNSVKTNEQYKALLKEIEENEKSKNGIEDSVLSLFEKMDGAKKTQKQTGEELRQRESEFDDRIKQLKQDKSSLEEKIKQDEAGRTEFISVIKPSIIKKYEHIRERMDGVALAVINGYTCGRCGMELPPQVRNNVAKIMNKRDSVDLVYCDKCSRILYLEEHEPAGGENGGTQP